MCRRYTGGAPHCPQRESTQGPHSRTTIRGGAPAGLFPCFVLRFSIRTGSHCAQGYKHCHHSRQPGGWTRHENERPTRCSMGRCIAAVTCSFQIIWRLSSLPPGFDRSHRSLVSRNIASSTHYTVFHHIYRSFCTVQCRQPPLSTHVHWFVTVLITLNSFITDCRCSSIRFKVDKQDDLSRERGA